jgi:hypothetical protein
MTPLSTTLDAAIFDAALQRQFAELTLLAVKGFSPSRTGNAASEALETCLKLADALRAVVESCEIEAAPNVVRFRSQA